MKVLFVGGTGSISCSCAHHAVQIGCELSLITRGKRMYRAPKSAKLINIDFNVNYKDIISYVRSQNWDCVVNWIVNNPDQARRDIEVFRDRVRHYIFISSASVYQQPVLGKKIVENDPIGKTDWLYAKNKIKCEQIFTKEYKCHNFPVTIVRPGHTYCDFTIPTNFQGFGYGLVKRLLNKEEILVHNDGLSFWTMTHSDDFAKGFVALMGREETFGEIFHITSSEYLRWLDIFNIYADCLNIKPKFTFIPSSYIQKYNKHIGETFIWDKNKNMIYDNSKIKEYVKGYRTRVYLKDGIKRSIDWHFANKSKIYYKKDVAEIVDDIIQSYNKEKNYVSRKRSF